MLILHLRVSSSDSSEVERLASILGDPRSIPPISKNIFVGNLAWFGLAILLSNSASSQNKAPCWEVWVFSIFSSSHVAYWREGLPKPIWKEALQRCKNGKRRKGLNSLLSAELCTMHKMRRDFFSFQSIFLKNSFCKLGFLIWSHISMLPFLILI